MWFKAMARILKNLRSRLIAEEMIESGVAPSYGSPDFMVYNVTNNTFTVINFYLDYILDLPGVKVESCTQIEGKILLGLRIVGEGMVCHHCQNYTEKLHQNRPILVRDLPVFGRPVYLKIPRRQFYCPICQRYPTEKINFLDIKRRHTQRYEQIFMSVSNNRVWSKLDEKKN